MTTAASRCRLILASASPRRAELLRSAGFVFDIVPADVDETPEPAEPARDYALRVARDKARAVAARRPEADVVVLAADTVVVAAGRILGKPLDDDDAERMLTALSGATHEVHTAVVIRGPEGERSEVATTRVHVLPLTSDEIAWYIGTGESRGKAGAYAIQGRAARFVDWIEGSWSNVVGLPLATVHGLLKELERNGGKSFDPPGAARYPEEV